MDYEPIDPEVLQRLGVGDRLPESDFRVIDIVDETVILEDRFGDIMEASARTGDWHVSTAY